MVSGYSIAYTTTNQYNSFNNKTDNIINIEAKYVRFLFGYRYKSLEDIRHLDR